MNGFRRLSGLIALTVLMSLAAASAQARPAATALLSKKESLGKQIFFDQRLSSPDGQSCASCHDPGAGFADPRRESPVSEGAVAGRFGFRNAPSVSYASFSPTFTFNPGIGPMMRGVYEGGQNWDGAAATLHEQAKLPFLNPLEMNNSSKLEVVQAVRSGRYSQLFRSVYGTHSLTNINRDHPEAVDLAYDRIADAIVAYESSAEVNRFSSRYDEYLAGEPTLTEQELRGLTLFRGKGACDRCHRSQPSANGTPPLFTSRHHANTGLPKNPENPYYWLPPEFNPQGVDYVDLGTGVTVGDDFHYGRFKIPTLRNIALTAPYMHNGCLPDLKSVVHFYNTRDVIGAGWPAPEWPYNIIRADNLGKLALTPAEEDDIVAFLEALTDR